jgi:uncharacterized protein (DUF2384 family)
MQYRRYLKRKSDLEIKYKDLYAFGCKIFGDQLEFKKWLKDKNNALGDKAPIELMGEEKGREEIRNLIGRIAYGIYS